MRKVTPKQALELIINKKRVVILLEKSDEPLCKRARQTFLVSRLRIRQLGYSVYAVEVNEESSKYKELACVRVPQTRLFVNQEMVQKQVGVPSEQFIADLLTEKFE
jgi:hypothetical protein